MITLQRPPLNEERKEWADFFFKIYLMLRENFAEDKIALLSSKSSVDMQTSGDTTIFTTISGKKTRITHVVVRDPSASMAGGTSFSFTSWRQAFSLAGLTNAGTDYIVIDGNNAVYSEISGDVDFKLTVTTGTTAACTATIDVFGYVTG